MTKRAIQPATSWFWLPLRDEEKVRGVVEIFQRPTSGPASQRGYLRFLTEMCQHAGDYLRSRRLRELNDWQSLFTEMDRFSLAVHEGLDPVTTAYTIANDARRLIGCDRVSVALRKGSKCTVARGKRPGHHGHAVKCRHVAQQTFDRRDAFRRVPLVHWKFRGPPTAN